MSNQKAVVFLASIAALQSGIQISGDGNGARLKLDIPETELGNALPLLAMRNVLLKVMIEPCDDETNFGGRGNRRAKSPNTTKCHSDIE